MQVSKIYEVLEKQGGVGLDGIGKIVDRDGGVNVTGFTAEYFLGIGRGVKE